ncbi:MAG: hypothetical protein AAFP85_04890 [Pseudomonadota bacterium]
MANQTDPYSFAAGRLPTETRQAIRAFWSHFQDHADALDQCFRSNMTDMTTDPTDVMGALAAVSPDLMWEFGPSDRGHALTITAEWKDANRPLARAVCMMAPNLPRWRLYEVRSVEADNIDAAEYFAARFREPLVLTGIDTAVGRTGRIDLVAHGPAKADTLEDHAIKIATSILGEEVERDWLGFVDAARTPKAGLLGRLRGQRPVPLDAIAFADSFRAAIALAKSKMPTTPYSAMSLKDRGMVLVKPSKMPADHPRSDLLFFVTTSSPYAEAVLLGGRFSSRCYSLHDEWFLYLRIPRSADAPFDDVQDRYDIEERLHDALSKDGLGGMVAAGHGREAVYIDVAVTDVALGIERIAGAIQGEVYAEGATLHFLDEGVQDLVLPAAPELVTLN